MTTNTLLFIRRVHLVAMVDAFEEGNTVEAQVISRSLTLVNRKLAKRGIHPNPLPIGLLTATAKSKRAKRRLARAIEAACEVAA